MADSRYDAVIIGSGQGGGPLATALAAAGLQTALIEREHIGGTCINEGCSPTKTMVASARVAYLARRSSDYGVDTTDVSVDMTVVRDRKRRIVENFRSGSEQKLVEGGVEIVRGEASFAGPKHLRVSLTEGGVQEIEAGLVFINAGCRPRRPEIEGIDAAGMLDSTSVMELDRVPDHLLVMGGGYIALEFGQMFRRFGSQVTVVQRGPQLLPKEDQDVASAVTRILEEDGVTVLLETSPVRVDGKNGSEVTLTVKDATGERALSGTHLLAAAGRAPNTEMLNLGAAGVATDDRGFITVNDRLETGVPGVYALGDVKGGPQFTHISYDDFRIIRTNLIEKGSATIADRIVPYTVFIDPQLGRVGMTEQEARRQGNDIRVARMPMTRVARALEMDESRGLIKAIVDAKTDQILGAAVLGIEGGEIMSIIEVAMMGKLPYQALREGIFAHPTLAESLNNLFNNFVE